MILSPGMWIVKRDTYATSPFKEVTEDFIKILSSNKWIDDSDIKKSFIIADSKDELKTVVLGMLFKRKDDYEKDLRDKLEVLNGHISRISGA